MPIHDWTRVEAGLFHDFHQRWSVRIADALNAGTLPKGYFALIEQHAGDPVPDVIALQLRHRGKDTEETRGPVAVAKRPKTRLVQTVEIEAESYARKANRIVVHHPSGTVVAIIEIMSPGNKSSRAAIRAFVTKVIDFIAAGVHVLVVDLFPPTKRDPQGIHHLIWEEFGDEQIERPRGQPFTLVGYKAGDPLTAYIETAAVGDRLRDMPLFISEEKHILVPLEKTYAATWKVTPEPVRDEVAG